MKITLFAAFAVTLSLLALASTQPPCEGITPALSAPVKAQSNQRQKMTITRSGTRASSRGPEANFTGNVSIEALFPANAPSRTSGGSVTFEPGARSAWHTHPLGQTLIMKSGTGWVQQEGGEKQEIKPGELSEIITHLAFYSGWANAMSAIAVAKDVFSKRGIGSDQLPPAAGELLPLDEAAEAERAARVEQDAGPVAPGVVQYTSDVLFHDLWLRPALAPRDRSLVTISAL